METPRDLVDSIQKDLEEQAATKRAILASEGYVGDDFPILFEHVEVLEILKATISLAYHRGVEDMGKALLLQEVAENMGNQFVAGQSQGFNSAIRLIQERKDTFLKQ